MKILYKTRNQISEEKLSPAGEYHFVVQKAEEQFSEFYNKKYLNLTLKISSPTVKERTDWVKMYEDDSEKWLDFCETVGLVDKLKNGTISLEDCLNKEGALKVTRLEPKGEFKANNKITFIPKLRVTPSKESVVDDEIPF